MTSSTTTFDFTLLPNMIKDSANTACILIALILTIVLVCTFLAKRNKNNYSGFAKHIYDFFNFRCFILDDILKFLYLLCASYYSLVSIVLIFSDFASGLAGLIISNLLLRIGYELLLLFFNIAKNISEINRKLGKTTQNTNKQQFTTPQENVDNQASVNVAQSNTVEDTTQKQEITTNNQLELNKQNNVSEEITTSYCPNCGTKVTNDYNNCPNCGTNLRN